MTTADILKSCILNLGASDEAIDDAASSIGYSLPTDYVGFLRSHNGGEGFVGANYLILWTVQELAAFNREYEVEKYAPGILLFASSGGGTCYGFDTRDSTMPVVSMEFIGMSLNDLDLVGSNFSDFLNRLASPI